MAQPSSLPRGTAGVAEGNRGLPEWPTTDLAQRPTRGEGCGQGPSASRGRTGPASLVEEEPKAKRGSQEQGAVPVEHAPAHKGKRRLNLKALTFSKEQWAKFSREKKKRYANWRNRLLRGEQLLPIRRSKKKKGEKEEKAVHSQLVSWCFEPSQPQRITSGPKTNFGLSPGYSLNKL